MNRQSSSLFQDSVTFQGSDRRKQEVFQGLLEQLHLQSAFDLLGEGLRNAVRCELSHKKIRRAAALEIAEPMAQELAYAGALNRRSIDQLRAAAEQARLAAERLDADPQLCKQLEEAVRTEEFQQSVQEEFLPDVRQRLLHSHATPAEAALLFQGLGDADAYQQPVRENLRELGEAIEEVVRAREEDNRGTETTPEGVPRWKVIATNVTVIVVRILITVCKVILNVVCFIIDIVWKLVEKEVVEEIYGWCRDSKPAPVQP